MDAQNGFYLRERIINPITMCILGVGKKSSSIRSWVCLHTIVSAENLGFKIRKPISSDNERDSPLGTSLLIWMGHLERTGSSSMEQRGQSADDSSLSSGSYSRREILAPAGRSYFPARPARDEPKYGRIVDIHPTKWFSEDLTGNCRSLASGYPRGSHVIDKPHLHCPEIYCSQKKRPSVWPT